MIQSPSTTGGNGDGRASGGRFGTGNKFAVGNPNARRVARLRQAMLKAATPEKMKKVLNRLIDKALDGDVAAAREVFERTLGKPIADDVLARLERLEALAKGAES